MTSTHIKASAIVLALAVVLAPGLAQAADGCSYYGNDENARRAADVGNSLGGGSGGGEKAKDWVLAKIGQKVGDSTKYIDYILTTPPDTGPGKALISQFNDLRAHGYAKQWTADAVRRATPSGQKTLSSGRAVSFFTAVGR